VTGRNFVLGPQKLLPEMQFPVHDIWWKVGEYPEVEKNFTFSSTFPLDFLEKSVTLKKMTLMTLNEISFEPVGRS
jgi:hypothetical protein